jgi:hypothetical protein
MRDKSQGISADDKGKEQPTDNDRAQKARKAEPGHMPSQPMIEDKPKKD